MVIDCVISFHMGGHVANPVFPFSGRIREIHTEFTGGIFSDSLAAITLLDNRVTAASIESASSLCHEDALVTLS
jgi:hypothetical protein